MNGFTGVPLLENHGFALVRNADCGKVLRPCLRLRQSSFRDLHAAPLRSNNMARELVVPWSRAKTYFGIAIFQRPHRIRLAYWNRKQKDKWSLPRERLGDCKPKRLNYLSKDAILNLFTF